MKIRILVPFVFVLMTLGCGKSEESPAPLAVTVLATGANLAGANGIIFSPDNQLYVASVVGSNISILDPNTGEILRQLGASEGVVGPDDIDFAPDGSFYWTSILTGEVAGLTPDGQLIKAAQLSPGVNPITF